MFDFTKIAAASKEQLIRAWAIEQANLFYKESTSAVPESLVYCADKIEQYVKEGQPKEYVDDETLNKAHLALMGAGVKAVEADNLITHLLNAGILLRERT